jgi:hypothetical protein
MFSCDRYDKYVKIYKEGFLEPSCKIEEVFVNSEKSEKNGKVVAFDLDETIGSFADLHILWEVIEKYTNVSSEPLVDFNELLDLYPEFLRHGIINILEFIYHKKHTRECSSIFIYTNNQCKLEVSDMKQSWVSKIINYLTLKVTRAKNNGSPRNNIKLFDKIIGAFKINKKVIEVKRTSNEKTYADFIQCTLLPKTTEICFVDNTFFPSMKNERVYYIQPRSYYHYLTTDDIIDRLISWDILRKSVTHEGILNEGLLNSLEMKLYDHFLMNRRMKTKCMITENQLEIDIKISQRLMYYIRNFFYLSTRKVKTRKIVSRFGRFTRKKGHNPNSI